MGCDVSGLRYHWRSKEGRRRKEDSSPSPGRRGPAPRGRPRAARAGAAAYRRRRQRWERRAPLTPATAATRTRRRDSRSHGRRRGVRRRRGSLLLAPIMSVLLVRHVVCMRILMIAIWSCCFSGRFAIPGRRRCRSGRTCVRRPLPPRRRRWRRCEARIVACGCHGCVG